MANQRGFAFGVGWLLLMPLLCGRAAAQNTLDADSAPAVRLGRPISQALDDPTRSNRSTDGKIFHNVYQPEELPPPVADLPLPDSRASRSQAAYKPWTVDYVYLANASLDPPATSVQMDELGIAYHTRFPIFDRFLFSVRPFFGVTFLSGPGGPAPIVPEEVYKLAVDVQVDYQFWFNENLGISVGATPGIWTDFDAVSEEDIRVPARLLGTLRLSEHLFVAGGVLYTDNFYHNVLPAFGGIWNPNDRLSIELIFPRSRLVYIPTDRLQIYGVFERGGDTYNILTLGVDEDFQYRDYRVMLGVQSDHFDWISVFGEVGYAFDRLFRFDTQLEQEIDSAFIFRVGARF